jgi:hypothetical protein
MLEQATDPLVGLKNALRQCEQYLDILDKITAKDAAPDSLARVSEDDVMATADDLLIASQAHFLWAYRSRRSDRQSILTSDYKKFRDRLVEMIIAQAGSLNKHANALKEG